ncbi:LPXTG cell wall anchor domain-containing protein [Pseudarthrobacter sp. N5]|uniref:LPXTG cell wall anchor domain-containing protein n=1 Tax=Pseudarthrobacter sp. N5 TaxID=3418416 RepID=UPI003CF38A74
MKKSIAAIALAGSIALAGAVPAMATTYPAPPANAAVSDGTVGPGESFTFSGKGFLAGEPLTITVTPGNPPAANGASIAGSRSVAGKISVFLAPQTFNTTADGSGNFAFPMTISEAGTYTLTATGRTSGRTVSTSVTVVGAVSVAGSATGLPNTGADASLILWTLVGAGALAAGATSVVVVRRRAKTDVASA